MVPHITILIIAIIGAFVHGFIGFFVWGLVGFLGVIALGFILRKLSGGILPRKVRDETATDFIAIYPDLIAKAYPTFTPYQAKERVAALLDEMMKKATINNPSPNLSVAGNPEVFLPSAVQVAEEQPTDVAKELAQELVVFVRTHRLWYGHL